MAEQGVREALNEHWAASDSGDFNTEHAIYHEDAILDYPQSRERIVGRQNIQLTRTLQPNRKGFAVRRILGEGNLWVSELVLTYDNQPFYTVSIMEFRGLRVAHETQYFSSPFEPGESRKKWVQSMDAAGQEAPQAASPTAAG
jgi:hypothetical protein